MFSKKIHADHNLIHRTIAGEELLIPVSQAAAHIHGMIGLSESGSFLWKKMQDAPCTEDELVEFMIAEYDVSLQTAQEDVHAFVEKMFKLGIVKYEP